MKYFFVPSSVEVNLRKDNNQGSKNKGNKKAANCGFFY
tara:strand:+ start:137 stop:250 length:114 start_codon:yes stop_codon:yes gene_type:complete